MKVFGQLEAAQLENLAADPTGTGLVPGRIWFNTTDESPKLWTGTKVVDLDNKALADAEFSQQLTTPALPAAGQHVLYFKDDGTPFVLDSEGNDTPLGSGGGGGSKNYVLDTNSNIENTIGDWETDDGAGVASAGLTLATTDVAGEYLVGAKSLKISKDAVDRSGHFAKVLTETVDPADRGRVLYGSLEFNPVSGYAGGDLILEFYDVTNSAVLYAGVSSDLELMNLKGRAQWQVHTEDTTEQIQIRVKVNSASTTAFDVVIDDIKLGPGAQVLARPTNTIVKSTAGSNISTDGVISTLTFPLEIGKSYEVRSRMAILLNVGTDTDFVGRAIFRDGATALYTVDFTLNETADNANDLATFGVPFTFTATSAQLTVEGNSLSAGAQIAASSFVELERRFDLDTPSVITLNELSNKGAFLQAATSSTGTHTASGSFQTVIFGTVVEDTHGAYNPATGEWKAPSSGFINFSTSTGFAANGVGSRIIRIAKNGAAARNLAQYEAEASASNLDTYSGNLRVNKGDLVNIEMFQNSGGNLNYASGTLFFDIKYVQDLTTLGVVRNDEYLISENIIQNNIGTVALNTVTEIDPGWFLDVPEGTWKVDASAFMEFTSINTNATAYGVTILSTSPTAAGVNIANIVATNKGVSVRNGANSDFRSARWQQHFLTNPEWTTPGERIKIYAATGNLAGATQASISLNNNIGSALGKGFISARRLK